MKKLKYIILSMTIAFSIAKSTQVHAEPNEKRIYGKNRYCTAVEISKHGWTSSDKLVIASSKYFPDALCAAPLAKKLNAPILLSERDSLEKDVLDEIIRLKVKEAYIIGGEGVLSVNIKNELRKHNISCKRIYGDNRYETSLAIAKEMGTTSELALVSSKDFPDALSIAPIAATKGMPIILTTGENPPDIIKNYIIKSNINKSYIIGGTSIIGTSTEKLLKNPVRIYGKNRYDTNIKIVKEFNSANPNSIYIASGKSFPDALTGSILASKEVAPMIFLDNTVDEKTNDYMINALSSIKNITILGGEGVVPSKSLRKAKGEIEPDDRNTTSHSSNEKFDYDKYLKNIEYFKKYGQIKVSIDKDHIEVGDKFKLNYQILNKPKDCNEKPIFRIAMDTTASIDNEGNIEALSPGLAHAEIFFYGKSSGDIPVYIYDKNTPAPKNADEFVDALRTELMKDTEKLLTIDTHRAELYSNKLDARACYDKALDKCADYNDFRYGSLNESSAGYITIRRDYFIPQNEIIELKKARDEKCKQIISSIIKPGMSDYDKVLAIHDYVVNNTRYDYENTIKGRIPSISHTHYGALLKGIAVCDGYAKAVQHLCRLAGIDSYIVSGTTPAGDHAWNIVKIDGKYRHIDATFDDPVAPNPNEEGFMDVIVHSYFNLTDEEIAPTRKWDRNRYPVCD